MSEKQQKNYPAKNPFDPDIRIWYDTIDKEAVASNSGGYAAAGETERTTWNESIV